MKFATKNTIYSSLGSIIEYYDFVIYGMIAEIINKIFFQGSMMNTYLSFALGYLARPIGGLLFGALADYFGRKFALTLSILSIGFSTLCIGIICPESYGWQLIIILRLIQGISFGAEMPTALILILETNKYTHNHSFIISAATMGSILASLTFGGLFQILSEDQMMSFGWRIPFIIGGALAIICYFLRKNLTESPDFNKMPPQDHNIIKHTMKNIITNLPEISASTILMMLPAMLIITNLHLPNLLSTNFGFDKSICHYHSLIGLATMMFLNPLIAKFLYNSLLRQFSLFAIAVLITYIGLISLNTVLFFIAYQAIISICMIHFPKLISQIFKTNFRSTGLSISYNIAFLLGSFTPIFLLNSNIINCISICMLLIIVSISLIYLLHQRNVRRL